AYGPVAKRVGELVRPGVQLGVGQLPSLADDGDPVRPLPSVFFENLGNRGPRRGRIRRAAGPGDDPTSIGRSEGRKPRDRSVRSASVFTNKPITLSVSTRLRPAIGEPTTTSS